MRSLLFMSALLAASSAMSSYDGGTGKRARGSGWTFQAKDIDSLFRISMMGSAEVIQFLKAPFSLILQTL
jgi:hypothetical protein